MTGVSFLDIMCVRIFLKHIGFKLNFFYFLFYFLQDGEHFEKVEDEELCVKDVMHDLTYITHRRSVEKKKIEKLKAQLHILETEEGSPKNSHVIFVDSDKEGSYDIYL